MPNREKMHLDTDIGGDIDDLCALAFVLASPDVNLTGVTTVLEHDGKRAGYARRVLELAGRADVPVAAGADLRLGYARLEAALPPETGYWPKPVPPAPGPLEAALDLLEGSIDQGAIVVGIGPLTNLAWLERRKPGILREARLFVMGGHFRPPPTGFPALLDYNLEADPHAARVVMDAAQPTLVPVEVTAQTALRRADLPLLREAGPVARLIAGQAEAFAAEHQYAQRYAASCPGLPADIVNFQHDPLACAVALGWNGVTIERVPVATVTSVDAAAFSQLWLRTVLKAA